MLPTKFLFIWQSGFRREDFFRNHPIRNKNCLWWQYLLTDWAEMSNHNRGLSIDASYQTVSKEKNLIFSIVFYFLLIFFPLIFKFEKRQRPCLMAVGVIIHGLKENYICIVPLQFGSNIGSLQFLKNQKKKNCLVTIAAIFHKRPGLATISLEVDTYMHRFHQVWWQLALYRILKYFVDNNFLFFVTVTATLDDSQRSSIKMLKEDHICILSIWFDCI